MRSLLRRIALGCMLMVLTVGAAMAVTGDIIFKRNEETVSELAPAVFAHWFHRIRYKCYVCHTAIFEMKAGANDVTMEAILAGKFCGACHNGEIAWPVDFDTCNRCHAEK